MKCVQLTWFANRLQTYLPELLLKISVNAYEPKAYVHVLELDFVYVLFSSSSWSREVWIIFSPEYGSPLDLERLDEKLFVGKKHFLNSY